MFNIHFDIFFNFIFEYFFIISSNVNFQVVVPYTICEIKPLKIVFRESSFKNDSEKINAYERIKKLSPETEISVI